MSLVPAFEIGLWNAWIFIAYIFLLMIFPGRFKKGEDPGKAELDALNQTGRRIFNFAFQVLFIAIIYSIFLPLKLGTLWFYTGLSIALVGLFLLTITMINYTFTSWDKPITTGLYRFSRNPMYIATALFLLGVGIASASWLFLLLSLIFTILNTFRAINEEDYCLKKYGDAYRQYMKRTPRWLGIPKS